MPYPIYLVVIKDESFNVSFLINPTCDITGSQKQHTILSITFGHWNLSDEN